MTSNGNGHGNWDRAHPTPTQAAAFAEKRRLLVDARNRGMTWTAIAREVGYASAGNAHRAWVEALQAIPAENVEEARRLQSERMDALIEALWPRRGDEKVAGQIVRIEERRARLMGLDAPVTVRTGASELDDEIAALLAAMSEQERRQ